jgi:hypothetical protein
MELACLELEQHKKHKLLFVVPGVEVGMAHLKYVSYPKERAFCILNNSCIHQVENENTKTLNESSSSRILLDLHNDKE